MTAIAVEQRMTFAEWSRIVDDPTRDNAYQRHTRLGSSVANYLAWKKREASERTLVKYELYLATLCVLVAAEYGDPDVHGVTPDMLLRAADKHPPDSYKVVRTAFRNFFEWAIDWEGLTLSPARKLPRSRPKRQQIYDIFTPAEQAQLLKTAEVLPAPWIQRLRLEAFVDLGIRSEEARLLQPRDVDLVGRVVVIHAEGAKGDKERAVPFGDGFFKAFVTYMNRPIPNVRQLDDRGPFREARKPRDDDYLFFPLGYHRASNAVTWTDPGRPLADRSMRSWWDKVTELSGVRYRSLHMNRHTLGTNLSDAGEGIETIGEWLGHADPKTTKIYVHNARTRLQRGRGNLDAWRKAQGE